MMPYMAEKIWGEVKKYYHDTDEPITKCVVTLGMPNDQSSIHCEYTKGNGGIKLLSYEDVVFLFETVKQFGVSRQDRTQKVIITLESMEPVKVEQTYFL